jgi:hypothetical protein
MSLPEPWRCREGLISRHRQDAEPDSLDLQPSDDYQQITNRPGKPVELGDGELSPSRT